MITCMLSGTLAKAPETRTSRNGHEFTVSTVRIPTDDVDIFASITAFEPLAPILAGLAKGDPVTIIGQAKVTAYETRDGEHRAGLSITASRILALVDHEAPPRERKPKGNSEQRYRRSEEFMAAGPREFAPDPVPF